MHTAHSATHAHQRIVAARVASWSSASWVPSTPVAAAMVKNPGARPWSRQSAATRAGNITIRAMSRTHNVG